MREEVYYQADSQAFWALRRAVDSLKEAGAPSLDGGAHEWVW